MLPVNVRSAQEKLASAAEHLSHAVFSANVKLQMIVKTQWVKLNDTFVPVELPFWQVGQLLHFLRHLNARVSTEFFSFTWC